MPSKIDQLIVCDPYKMPVKHWSYDRTTREFNLVDGRRKAGYLMATPGSKIFDDPGIFQELKLVNQIRSRVDLWRSKNYPGITGTSRKLLEFWNNNNNDVHREKKFFFCQIEAIETLIWLTESSNAEKQGIKIPSDGGEFTRLCSKMATGIGKTIVMGMVIAWQTINKVTYPSNTKFSKNILVMSPGLTVKSRLQVLHPTDNNNIYDEFEMVPDSLREKLYQANIVIHNWHTLMPAEDAPSSVVKRGPESDNAFSRRILGHELNNIVVLNDEAHHAYRAENDSTIPNTNPTLSPQKDIEKKAKTGKKKTKDEDRDKRWIEGLDKIHRDRTIIRCFDFSATPFVPSGSGVSEDTLFDWIVSDFSLNDAIESGLTKTPRIVVRDDSNTYSKEYTSRFYHLYNDDTVKSDLNRNAKPSDPLPDLINNAYMLLGRDWTETKKIWDGNQQNNINNKPSIPPVMITVCNTTKTANRIKHSFEKKRFETLGELSDEDYLLHIDSTTIKNAEKQEQSGAGKKTEEELRLKVDTIGKLGMPGEQIRNIIAVQMLSEGWDARNVTHIMGLRAFSSQLLCEQVVGRGLRRMSYETNPNTGLYVPEYVNVFGVPFTFLPHEGGNGSIKPDTFPTRIETDPTKSQHTITWPNIDRIDVEYLPHLEVDWSKVEPVRINSMGISTTASMAEIIAGKPVSSMSDIDLKKLKANVRFQRVVFLASKDIYLEMSPGWKGTSEVLLAQIILLVESFIRSGKVVVTDTENDDLRTKMAILFNMQRIVKHVFEHITESNTEKTVIRLNNVKPTKSTSDMRTWYTKKPTEHNKKSHISIAPYEKGWELATIHELERNSNVLSWVKNDHIGFVIKYLYNGVVHDYWPDFLIRLKNNIMLVLEIKGIDSVQNKKKREYLKYWVDAVNDNENYGTWACDVAFSPCQVKSILNKHATSSMSSENTKCPRCNKLAISQLEIEKQFGYRNMDGVTRPQSWCKDCRSSFSTLS